MPCGVGRVDEMLRGVSLGYDRCWPFDVEPFHKAVALEIIDLAALPLQTKLARSSMDEPL